MDNYYDKHAQEFIDKTKDCDMSFQYNLVLNHIKEGKMLDIGFGSGRDMLYFKSIGFDVYGIDPIDKFYKHALDLGLNVTKTQLEDYNPDFKFDIIWACSSLLHMDDLNEAFKKCSSLLKKNGYLYTSFKYGNYTGFRGERFFIDLDENKVFDYLNDTNLKLLEYTVNNDVREGRKTELWINFIFKKTK